MPGLLTRGCGYAIIQPMKIAYAEALEKPWIVKTVACLFMVSGMFSLAAAGYGQYHGIVSAAAPGMLRSETALQALDPELFRNLIAYRCIGGLFGLFAGWTILSIAKGRSRLDPLSPDFPYSADDDEWDHPAPAALARRAPQS